VVLLFVPGSALDTSKCQLSTYGVNVMLLSHYCMWITSKTHKPRMVINYFYWYCYCCTGLFWKSIIGPKLPTPNHSSSSTLLLSYSATLLLC